MSLRIVTLDEIKQQIRYDESLGSLEDEQLTSDGETAEQAVLNDIQRTLEDLTETYGAVPQPLKKAVLMLVDDYYHHRGATTSMPASSKVNGYDHLIKPYMRIV